MKTFTEFAEVSTEITGVVRDKKERQIWVDENINQVSDAFSKERSSQFLKWAMKSNYRYYEENSIGWWMSMVNADIDKLTEENLYDIFLRSKN